MKNQKLDILKKLFEFDQSFCAYSVSICVVIGYNFDAGSTRNTNFTRNTKKVITAGGCEHACPLFRVLAFS